jgi:hypothetical protein
MAERHQPPAFTGPPVHRPRKRRQGCSEEEQAMDVALYRSKRRAMTGGVAALLIDATTT